MSAAEYLDRVEAAVAAATEGPWQNYGAVIAAYFEPNCGGCSGIASPAHEPSCGIEQIAQADEPDAAFIAMSRDAVPRMAAALRAVLAVDRRDLDESPDYEERLWDQGFNEALGDVVTAITAALDGAS